MTELTPSLIEFQDVDAVSKQTSTPLATVNADRYGTASFSWTVPADQPLGVFYLMATDTAGLVFGMTPTLELTTAPKRKLWGPHMTL